ncbi:flagellar biosynthesis repressor FlbT [Pyruvatibacter mobilis]|jgi:flagellar protein FlbT|uniref:Flagellar biosynthesis repressor FlbT n=1 Tax=Pyruvatibacter mobilis TaxID=1712261 RepID=A0A845QEM8_9HYPH|nr:flagellar biosynthesis repressor FlbT [Pyruvatibacter mobilis]NBG96481.1 flagellar biosynthesis repressor FlbT [Pyruvatibacter mobilis]QJD74625.1 flagellar biosynthesis repressor FlbT [Pyruvatibacter mobilis]GGD08800.1 putative flagellum biosynthesis repressor protein FlbT 1 [Pyruvatibacter mobilis]
MALKIELKPGERFILGNAVITNDDQRTRLFVEGSAPILREKDIMRPEEADSPCKRLYLAVQLMYLSNDPSEQHSLYFQLTNDIIQAAPSTLEYIERMNNQILTGAFYKALKEAKSLIEYEQELMSNAQSGAGVRSDG